MMELYNTLASLPIWATASATLVFFWLLTSRVNLEALSEAIQKTNSFFIYKGESDRIEKWRVLSPQDPEGDCEDNALTSIYNYSGSGLVFLWNITNMLKFRIWYVKDPFGNAHAIGVCKGLGFDNHQKKLVPVKLYKELGYKFVFPWPFPIIWLKLLIGKFK